MQGAANPMPTPAICQEQGWDAQVGVDVDAFEALLEDGEIKNCTMQEGVPADLQSLLFGETKERFVKTNVYSAVGLPRSARGRRLCRRCSEEHIFPH